MSSGAFTVNDFYSTKTNENKFVSYVEDVINLRVRMTPSYLFLLDRPTYGMGGAELMISIVGLIDNGVSSVKSIILFT